MAVKNKNMLLETPIRPLIAKMAVPTIIAQLITTIYNLVDTFFVSSLGTNATAAVGVNSSLDHIISLIAMLIGSGAMSYISRLLGRNDQENADEVLSTSFATGMGAGVIFAIACLSILKNLVYWLGATSECAAYSEQYGFFVLIAAPFVIGSLILNKTLGSEGKTTWAMVGIGFGGILNCFLDPLFIFKLNMGVAGASLATAISKFISFCILLYPYIVKKTNVRMSVRLVHFRAEAVKEVVAVGSTAFFRSGLSVVSSIIMNRIAGSYSTSVLAAISVANRVMLFPFAIILGFGQGYQPVAGFNWGAKQYKRVKESFNFGNFVSIVGSALMGLIIFCFGKQIIHVFNSQADSEVLRVGLFCLRIQCVALPVHAWVSIINMLYAGIGKAKNAMLLSTARQGYFLIPLFFILPAIFGEIGLAACQAGADALTLLIAVPMCITGYKLINKGINGELVQEASGKRK